MALKAVEKRLRERACDLLQLCESCSVVAPPGGVLQVLAKCVSQGREGRVEVLQGQLGTARAREEEEEEEESSRKRDTQVSTVLI